MAAAASCEERGWLCVGYTVSIRDDADVIVRHSAARNVAEPAADSCGGALGKGVHKYMDACEFLNFSRSMAVHIRMVVLIY